MSIDKLKPALNLAPSLTFGVLMVFAQPVQAEVSGAVKNLMSMEDKQKACLDAQKHSWDIRQAVTEIERLEKQGMSLRKIKERMFLNYSPNFYKACKNILFLGEEDTATNEDWHMWMGGDIKVDLAISTPKYKEEIEEEDQQESEFISTGALWGIGGAIALSVGGVLYWRHRRKTEDELRENAEFELEVERGEHD